jgi:hypothetical protein
MDGRGSLKSGSVRVSTQEQHEALTRSMKPHLPLHPHLNLELGQLWKVTSAQTTTELVVIWGTLGQLYCRKCNILHLVERGF